MATLLQNQKYFYDHMNEIIEISLKETMLHTLERDLKLRFTTDNDKLSYLLKLKRELIDLIDKETNIEVYHLIDIVDSGTRFTLDKCQFMEFCEHWLNLNFDFEKETSLIIDKHKGDFETIIEKLKTFNSENKATAPEEITQLSFWMYCINSHLEKVRENQGKEFKPNLTIFKNSESHRFFDFLYNDWLKDIDNCRPQLSYIVSAMREAMRASIKDEKEGIKTNRLNDFAITCPSLEDFINFWNDNYSHPFRLTFKNSKPNLSDEPGDKYQAPFNNRKMYFLNNMI